MVCGTRNVTGSTFCNGKKLRFCAFDIKGTPYGLIGMDIGIDIGIDIGTDKIQIWFFHWDDVKRRQGCFYTGVLMGLWSLNE